MTILLPKKEFWIDTEIESIQDFIRKKQGAEDYEIERENCRTRIILEYLEKLIQQEEIPPDFRLVDLFCGDAIIITLLKNYFKESQIIGVDINEFNSHEAAINAGVEIKYKHVQRYIKNRRGALDVLLMLNTYRNLRSSGMSKYEFKKINKWILKTCKHPIVTVKNVKKTEKYGFKPKVIGQGEGTSYMVDLKGEL